MKYSFPGRVRFSEIDEDGNLSLYHMINYLQDCSTFHAEDNGGGLAWNRSTHRAWILAAWQILIDEYPVHGDRMEISTWAYGFKACIGYRNYTICTPDGRTLVRANSDWVLMDMEHGRPVRVGEDQVQTYGVHPEWKLTDAFGDRKIRMPEGGEEKPPFRIEEYHLDTNHHVNNGRYFLMAEAYLPHGFRPKRIRAEYKKQAHLGDLIYPRVLELPDGYLVTMNDGAGEPYFVGELKEG